MNEQTYSYILPSPLNCVVNILYANYPETIVNIENLNYLIRFIHNFFRKYNDNIFDKAVINIWDWRRDDYELKNYSGFNWVGENIKRIDLSSGQTGSFEGLRLVLFHEIGHIIDWVTEKNNPNDIIMPEYRRIEEAVNKDSDSPPVERMAEHILELLLGYGRGKFKSVQQIPGLNDMLLIWHRVWQFVQAIKSFSGQIRDVSHHYLDYDFYYYACMFEAYYNENQIYHYYCDRVGWQEYFPSKNTWEFIAKF